MGIPGLLKEIGKGERVALAKLAIEHLERQNRPLRIAIDASIWNFQLQSSQGGKNPVLRAFFYRLLKLLALPIQPVFVYDGKNKPLTKRGRTVTRYHGTCLPNELSKDLVSKFCFPWHVAPGEAEAECALLQRKGVVDMVMSQDVDAIMFGAGVTLRDWSKEGTRGNKAPTHVNVMDAVRLKEISGLDSDGMVLVALLSGGDYNEAGVPGFGPGLACEIARAGFGKDLIELIEAQHWDGLAEWRARLRCELETNESGYFKRKHKALQLPDTFPDLKILGYYTNPAVSTVGDLPSYENKWVNVWNSTIDVPALRAYTTTMFEWCWKSGARHFVRCIAQPLLQQRLSRGTVALTAFTVDSITERREHFVNDGIPELRLSAVPAEVVAIDIEAEVDNPICANEIFEDTDDVVDEVSSAPMEGEDSSQSTLPVSPSKRRKSPPWDPYAREKWWIPETLLQLGMPAIVEDWHQLQRDICADSQKFAARKAVKGGKTAKHIDTSMKTGAIHRFFSKTTKAKAPKENTMCNGSKKPTFACEETHQTIKAPTNQAHTKAVSEKTQSEHASSFSSALDAYQLELKSSQNESTLESLSAILQLPSTVAAKTTSERNKAYCPDTKKFENQLKAKSGKACTGATKSAAVKIDSSPPPQQLRDIVEARSSPDDMGFVTQRRVRQRSKPGPAKSKKLAPESPSRIRRPIESFFPQSSPTGSTKAHTKHNTPFTASEPMALSNEHSSYVTAESKERPSARPSLPGTWKKVPSAQLLVQKSSRVSYVNLTVD